ncbi:hypothetical protein BDV98DRAFT_606867 [Pterulicium gracile]|uniref:Uncharacterized protein n=1 Tax=Pterulicium gracile TaxID=1884261 RepID=A0A5C3Q932_9AGAR|nr:hypothetical protein BDV98DRAFT_606867 [Pterula gracilis]
MADTLMDNNSLQVLIDASEGLPTEQEDTSEFLSSDQNYYISQSISYYLKAVRPSGRRSEEHLKYILGHLVGICVFTLVANARDVEKALLSVHKLGAGTEAGANQSTIPQRNTLEVWFLGSTFKRDRGGGEVVESQFGFGHKRPDGNGPTVHERTMKGLLAHGVSLGKETTVGQEQTSYVFTIAEDLAISSSAIPREPNRLFSEVLESRGIIERPPPPAAAADAQHSEEMDTLQSKVVKLEQLVRELRGGPPATRVKRERESSSEDVMDLTGAEPVATKRKRQKTQTEVIDLTLDWIS